MTGTGEGQFFRFWPLAGVRHGISPSEVGMFRAVHGSLLSSAFCSFQFKYLYCDCHPTACHGGVRTSGFGPESILVGSGPWKMEYEGMQCNSDPKESFALRIIMMYCERSQDSAASKWCLGSWDLGLDEALLLRSSNELKRCENWGLKWLQLVVLATQCLWALRTCCYLGGLEASHATRVS